MDAICSEALKAIAPEQQSFEAFWASAIPEFIELTGISEAQLINRATKKYPSYTRGIAVQIFIAASYAEARANVLDIAHREGEPAVKDELSC